MRAVPIHPILLAPSLLKNEKFIQKVISLTKLKKILHRNIKLCCYYQTKKNKKKPKKKNPKQNSLVAAAGTRFGSSSSSHNFTSPTQTMGDPHTFMTFHEEVRPRGEVK